MMCQKCGKNIATVHTVTVINGVKDEKYLCSDCANMKDFDMNFNFPTANDFFKGFFEPEEKMLETLTCPSCKTTYQEFCDIGMLGCPECYENFRNRLAPVIKKLQGGNSENKPESGEKIARDEKKDELKELKRQLKAAIKEENFEEAARLRDLIKEAEDEK